MKLNNKLIEKTLVDFIQKETDKIGIKKAIIGLSGGLDSSTSAYLTAKALGSENVFGVLMPYKSSSKDSITDANLIVELLNIRSKTVEITDMVEPYFVIDENKDMTYIRKGNVMARVRMIVLYDESARENALVMGTGNKTEILLGYTTLFGDSACAINPVGDLYKTQLRDLARYMGVPQDIIDKKPSADLWIGQTDEDELGFTYEDIDNYLYQMLDEKKSVSELIKAGFNKSFMQAINSLITKNEFKRLPAVIAKLSN
jgi:NAD+ synthase